MSNLTLDRPRANTSPAAFKLERASPAVGAHISGIDLAQRQSPETYQALRQALVDHGVIFFRNQFLDAEQFEHLGEQFGEIHRPNTELIPALPGTRATAELKKKPGQARNVGGRWHTDQMHSISPSWACLLLARKTPATGGDTLWASMAKVYESLSPGLQLALEQLKGVHTDAELQKSQATGRAPAAPAVHPAVVTHPLNRRKIMYVCSLMTRQFEGWTEEESKPLIDYLYSHAQRPDFSCRFKWEPGSMAIWDNFQTWHFACNDYEGGDERVMHRIVVRGPEIGALS
jgi:taurine dioxygenase